MSKKQRDTVRKQFTSTAEAFAKFAVRDTSDVLAEKVDFSKPQSTDLVLDVACGPGAFVLAIAPRVRFARGIDVTEQMLRQAREFQSERGVSNVAFDCGEAEQLPYPDAAFDLVSSQMSLHHVSKPELVLKEMVRVAKPEGRLVLIDALSPEIDSKFDLHNRIERARDPSHTLSLRLTTFLEMFEANRLEILKQAVRRRQRSFNDWMLRAGSKPGDKRYLETRKLLEESLSNDGAGYTAVPQEDDILIVHNEGMFLLEKAVGTGS